MPRGKGLPLDPARLRAARTAAGLSQRLLAERLGTTRQQVIRYESGAERPEVRRLAALAAAVGVGVADLVAEGALPAGLAGLRVGAGLTLAAAATAVRAHIPTGAGIACSRPVLADAERGVLPPTWAPPPAAGAVRNALGVAYGAGVEEIVAAWSATFGTAAADVDQAAQEPGSINRTSDETVSETAPLSSVGAVELPFDSEDQEHEQVPAPDPQQDVRLERVGVEQMDAFELGAARMWRVRRNGVVLGFVWRDADAPPWYGARAADDGGLGDIAILSSRYDRTRQSVVEHLLDPTAPYITAPVEVQEQDDAAPDQGVAVLVKGDPDSGRVHLSIEVDGHYVGHLADLRTWNGQNGWAFHSPLTDQERRTLSRIEAGARPPKATTTVTDIAAAVRTLLPQVLQAPVRIDSLHGHHTGMVGMYPPNMERWELYRGRVPGREDVYARSRCWGWLQPADGSGYTAHTTAGPVPGGPWPTREEAVLALWAHLTAPLPPPRLEERAQAKRRIRPRRDARPLCPYTPEELARARLIRDRPEVEHSPYRAESPVDHRVLGYVWRKDVRRWSYAPAEADTGRPPEYTPALPTAPTRTAALEKLLAQPGPLWADPADAILH